MFRFLKKILKMKFSCGIKLVVVSLLLAIILHEGSAEPTNYLKMVFGARQGEARRNRMKYMYNPEANDVTIYTPFPLKENLTEFELPVLLNDDKLEQTFPLRWIVKSVRRMENEDQTLITKQQNALKMLKHRKLYLYEAHDYFGTTFELIPRPLTKAEEEIILNKLKTGRDILKICNKPPMPGLQLVPKGGIIRSIVGDKSTIKYKYGEDNQTCDYFQLGIETLDPWTIYEYTVKILTQTKSFWAPLFDVCHDVINSVTVFTKHTIKSDHLIHRKLNPNIKVNPEEEQVFVGQHFDQSYDLKNQEKSFEASECQEERKEFSMESNYLVRAHLVPDYDHLYESWQYITNNYLNYVPQWRSVNMGQWLKVEQDIRFMALKLQKDVTIHTGVYYGNNPCKLIISVKEEVKQNTSTSSDTIVEPKSIPIPLIFYKYVHTDEAGIVIITANGVSGDLDEIECEDVCVLYGWLYQQPEYRHRNSVSSGKTKCCTPEDFFNQPEMRNFLASLPKGELARTKILTFTGLEERDERPKSDPVMRIWSW